jgi:uncharacterized protein (DUF1499 family)
VAPQWQRYVLVLIAGEILVWLARIFVQMISKPPSNLGAKDGKLAPCSGQYDCASTQGLQDTRKAAPIPFTTSTADAKGKMIRILKSMKRMSVEVVLADYLRAEYQSADLGLIDDVEFYFDEESHLIHFRSAARLPYRNWGFNRRRMEAIRRDFESSGR